MREKDHFWERFREEDWGATFLGIVQFAKNILYDFADLTKVDKITFFLLQTHISQNFSLHLPKTNFEKCKLTGSLLCKLAKIKRLDLLPFRKRSFYRSSTLLPLWLWGKISLGGSRSPKSIADARPLWFSWLEKSLLPKTLLLN